MNSTSTPTEVSAKAKPATKTRAGRQPPGPPLDTVSDGEAPTPSVPRLQEPPPSTNGGNGTDEAKPNHDARGRWAKGNKGGPGNPFARQTARFRSMLVGSVSDDDFKAVVQALTNKAKAGDLNAIELFFHYLVGRPADAINPDAVDQDELDLLRKIPNSGDLKRATDRLTSEAAVVVARTALERATVQTLAGKLFCSDHTWHFLDKALQDAGLGKIAAKASTLRAQFEMERQKEMEELRQLARIGLGAELLDDAPKGREMADGQIAG
jgi:hypothetical protein